MFNIILVLLSLNQATAIYNNDANHVKWKTLLEIVENSLSGLKQANRLINELPVAQLNQKE